MDHTPAQIADLLYSRQLYYRKLGQLARDRKALISKMSSGETDMSHVSDKLSGWTEMSEKLRSIGREEYRTYLQSCACFYHGVSMPPYSHEHAQTELGLDGLFRLLRCTQHSFRHLGP